MKQCAVMFESLQFGIGKSSGDEQSAAQNKYWRKHF